MQKQCIWVQNLKQGKDSAHTVEIGLNLETKDSDQPPEVDFNQEGVIMNQDQGMIDSKLQREEKSQTVMIDRGRPQDQQFFQGVLCVGVITVLRIRRS